MDRKAPRTRLSAYLRSVKEGKLVNFTSLEQELKKRAISSSDLHDCFTVEMVKPKKYRVHIQDEAIFDSLYSRFVNSSTETRTGAAFAGDSHRTQVSGSFLLLRNMKTPRPVAVWFEAGTFFCPVEQSRYALLVENLENYIATHQMVSFMAECGVVVESGQIDIIYASGNQITNKLHSPFLGQYQKVYCLFDVDLGALKIYKALSAMLPNAGLRFVYPENVAQRLKYSERKMSLSERAELLNYKGLSVYLDELILHMRDTGNKLEQETYIELSE
jgi:hypothetical protein